MVDKTKYKFFSIDLFDDGIIILRIPIFIARSLKDIKHATKFHFMADKDFVVIELLYNNDTTATLVLPDSDVELALY